MINNSSAFVLSPQAQTLQPMADAPQLTAAGAELLRAISVLDEAGQRRELQIPVERPLTVRIDGRELVTLMTLGAAPELLVLGYLRNQRIIERATQVESISVDWANCGAAVVLRDGAAQGSVEAARVVGTACSLGTVFGEQMLQLDAQVAPRATRTARITSAQLLRILDISREYDAIHRTAGSVHGCALFHGADLLLSIEDVSRHNGLDTVTGWMLLHGVWGGDKTLFTTGRLTGEMVMKAAHNDVSLMVSRNGVTSMGLDLAVKLGMVLFGRAAKGRYLCYVGTERLDNGLMAE